MGSSAIEWVTQILPDGREVGGFTLNSWSGCTKVILDSGKPDPQCVFCYAEREEDKRRHRVQWGKGNPRTQFKGWRYAMRKWNDAAKKEGVFPYVFAQSLSDWADEEVPDAWRDELFGLAEKNDHLTYLFLTKRVRYAAEYWARRYPSGLPDHFAFGFSAGNLESFLSRAGYANDISAAMKFMSVEPYAQPIVDALRPMLVRPATLEAGAA